MKLTIIEKEFKNQPVVEKNKGDDLTFVECTFKGGLSEKLDLRSTRFVKCRFESHTFKHCALDSASFAECSFDVGRFENSRLSGSSFTNTEVKNVLFNSCDLSGSDFVDCAIKAATFGRCSISASSFTNCHITRRTQFNDCFGYSTGFDENTILEEVLFERAFFDFATFCDIETKSLMFLNCRVFWSRFDNIKPMMEQDSAFNMIRGDWEHNTSRNCAGFKDHDFFINEVLK